MFVLLGHREHTGSTVFSFLSLVFHRRAREAIDTRFSRCNQGRAVAYPQRHVRMNESRRFSRFIIFLFYVLRMPFSIISRYINILYKYIYRILLKLISLKTHIFSFSNNIFFFITTFYYSYVKRKKKFFILSMRLYKYIYIRNI